MDRLSKVQCGFTLIELVVTVAIIGILAAIAIPAYNSQVEKGRLADARAALTQDGHFLERWYADNGTYLQGGTAWPSLPVTETDYFNITFTNAAPDFAANVNAFTLQANPKPLFDRDGAKYLKLDQDGNILTCTAPGGGAESCNL